RWRVNRATKRSSRWKGRSHKPFRMRCSRASSRTGMRSEHTSAARFGGTSSGSCHATRAMESCRHTTENGDELQGEGGTTECAHAPRNAQDGSRKKEGGV